MPPASHRNASRLEATSRTAAAGKAPFHEGIHPMKGLLKLIGGMAVPLLAAVGVSVAPAC